MFLLLKRTNKIAKKECGEQFFGDFMTQKGQPNWCSAIVIY